ncbi:MAG: hypothetical protein UU13_C0001G0045 [Candidatus Nomurabacteria bacterium GW2011_GWB1_40_7]|uniref:Baseplate protein J-like domain-containing protein n=1 Tax=Candidatus Nomurabacteria bacterium GW2011_GWB1_40_7 TaxID=1618744 RepID=A0A0G0W6D3_9BACT|nr:MAG: hypothetical protein UU13_C0001G0045 [Candidatus Nomurabacteria bacterium GW2011_GWB1_40_7]
MSKLLLKDMIKIKDIRKDPRPRKIEKRVSKETAYDKKRSGYMLWFVAIISVAFFFFAVSFLFSKAEITVNPKTKDVVLNDNLSANKDSNGDLSFDLVVIGGEENKTIKAAGEKDVVIKATGTTVIYNAFGASAQTLAIDTRLEGSNGKIYKTQAKTVVPGMDKKGVPGSVEVKIYASVAGADYNSSPLDFKIIGFKGTPKYAKFYGRSKGEITGGFTGKVPVVSDEDKASALADLKTALSAKLSQKATNQIPNGFILFEDAIFIKIDDSNVSLTDNKDNNATLTLKGALYGFLFNEGKLTKKIAKDNIEEYDESEVYIPNIRDLTFILADKENVSFGGAQTINFNLSGPAKIVWKLDEEKFTADLLERSKKDFNQILSQYPNIDSANLSLTPMWKMSIPDKLEDIKVIVNYPK